MEILRTKLFNTNICIIMSPPNIIIHMFVSKKNRLPKISVWLISEKIKVDLWLFIFFRRNQSNRNFRRLIFFRHEHMYNNVRGRHYYTCVRVEKFGPWNFQVDSIYFFLKKGRLPFPNKSPTQLGNFEDQTFQHEHMYNNVMA